MSWLGLDDLSLVGLIGVQTFRLRSPLRFSVVLADARPVNVGQ